MKWMQTVRETPERIPNWEGVSVNGLSPLAGGKGEATSAHLMSRQASPGQQLRWLRGAVLISKQAASRACSWHPLLKMQRNRLGQASAVSAPLFVERVGAGRWEQRLYLLPIASLMSRYLKSTYQGLWAFLPLLPYCSCFLCTHWILGCS